MLLILWCCASLVIRFDGSLRLPRDPIPGFMTAGLGRVASCGSAVLLDDDQTVVALGGRSIPLVPGMTSGDVEYDGLNLGLEWAVQAAERGELDRVWGSSSDDDAVGAAAAGSSIIIRGDCKTVIDHLNRVASPRKLKPKNTRSRECIDRLEDYARRRFGNVRVSYEHVSREENVLCDAVCSCAIDAKLAETISTVAEAIRVGEESSTNPSTRLGLPASKKKRFKFDKTNFDRVLGVISRTTVPYSSRLGLYREVARAADRSNDGVAIRRIGAMLVAESKRWPQTTATADTDAVATCTDKKDAEMLGILLGIHGLRLMSLKKEADQAESKCKIALNNDQPDLVSAFIGRDAGALGARGEVISTLSSCIEKIEHEEWSNLLDDWNRVAREQTIQNKVEGSSSIERGIWSGVELSCLDEMLE